MCEISSSSQSKKILLNKKKKLLINLFKKRGKKCKLIPFFEIDHLSTYIVNKLYR